MRSSFIFAVLLCAVALASAAITPAAKHHVTRATVPPPADDPFYRAPDGWKSKKNGEILRSRRVDVAYFDVDKMNIEAHQVLYKTTGAYESLDEATVATVLIPKNARKDQLVSYNVYTDSTGRQCAPSYNLRLGSNFATDLPLGYQTLLMTLLLDKGYTLVVSDYEGRDRGFGAGRMGGRMALDGVRAALNLKEAGLSKNAKVVQYGYSGGAIATGWATGLSATYSPEVNYVGFAMGGTAANLSSTLEFLDKGLFAGFAIAGVAGVVNAYTKVANNIYNSHSLTEKGQNAFDFSNTHCMLDMLLKFPGANVLGSEYIRPSGASFIRQPDVQKVLKSLVMGMKEEETPKAPTWVYHGKSDGVIPLKDAEALARRWAKHGADVKFSLNTNIYMEHLLTELLNLVNVYFFIEDRMAGKPWKHGLNFETVTDPLTNPRVVAEGLEYFVNTIKHFAGEHFGDHGEEKLKSEIRAHEN